MTWENCSIVRLFDCSINNGSHPFQHRIVNGFSIEKEPFVDLDKMRRRVPPDSQSNNRTIEQSNISQCRVKNRAHSALPVRARDVDGLELQLRIAERGAEVPNRLQPGLHPEAATGGKFVKEAHRETATATTAETAYPPIISQSILSERRMRSGRPTSPFLHVRNR